MRPSHRALVPCAVIFLIASACGSPQAKGGGDYGLTVTVRGEGSVLSTPPGVDCGPLCTAPFKAGSEVTLEPQPATGGAFLGWSGACTGAGACTVKMDGEKAVTAEFTVPLTVQVTTAGGKVTSVPAGISCPELCGAGFAPGTEVVLSAVADAGFAFAGWGGACSGSAATCTVTLDAAKTVAAAFAPLGSFKSLTVAVTGQGTVTSAPAGVNCPGDCAEPYAVGTQVTLTAVASAGAIFGGWGGACTGSSSTCTLTVSADTSVSAAFNAAPPGSLAVALLGSGAGTVTSSPAGISCPGDCGESWPAGTQVTLTATAGAGSTFVGWAGACSGTGSCSVAVSGAQSVSARFQGPGTSCGWSHHLKGPGRDAFTGLSIQPGTGRILLVGTLSGAVTLAGATVQAPGAHGNLAALVLDASGANLQSGFAVGDDGDLQQPVGVVLSGQGAWLPSGDVALGMELSGRMDFGSGQLQVQPSAWRTYVVSYSTAGAFKWLRAGGQTSRSPLYEGLHGLAVDPASGAVLLGSRYETQDTLGTTTAFTHAGFGDAMLGRYAGATGAVDWVKAAGAADPDDLFSVAVGPSGNVAFAGSFRGAANFGGGAFGASQGQSAIVGSYTSSGTFQFNRAIEKATGRAVAVAPNGDIVVAGETWAAADYGGQVKTPAGAADAFVARYGPTGTLLWVRLLGGTGSDGATAVSVDPSTGDVWVAGVFSDTVSSGGLTLTSAGAVDAFAARLSGTTGDVMNARAWGGPDVDVPLVMALDDSGNVLLAGEFSGTSALGGAAPFQATGVSDGFALCFAP